MASTTPLNGPRAVEPLERAGGHPAPTGGRAGRDRTAPPVLAGPLGGLVRRYWPVAPGLALGGGLYLLGTVSPAGSAVVGGGMAVVVLADAVRRGGLR